MEIPSGGTLAMAGMIQEQTKQQLNGMPGLMNLPVLGALFKSRDFVNRQTELMVLVTPYIVRAVAQKDLSQPDDGYADASDPATSLLGRFNRLYGTPGQDNARDRATAAMSDSFSIESGDQETIDALPTFSTSPAAAPRHRRARPADRGLRRGAGGLQHHHRQRHHRQHSDRPTRSAIRSR